MNNTTISLHYLDSPVLIVSQEYGKRYENQIDGVRCNHKSEIGYLVPLSLRCATIEEKNLFDPKSFYLSKIDHMKNKTPYKNFLEHSQQWFKMSDVTFIDDQCVEAWMPFIFSSIDLYINEYFNEDLKKETDKESGRNLLNLYKDQNAEPENIFFNKVRRESLNYKYHGILTWQNSD